MSTTLLLFLASQELLLLLPLPLRRCAAAFSPHPEPWGGVFSCWWAANFLFLPVSHSMPLSPSLPRTPYMHMHTRLCRQARNSSERDDDDDGSLEPKRDMHARNDATCDTRKEVTRGARAARVWRVRRAKANGPTRTLVPVVAEFLNRLVKPST